MKTVLITGANRGIGLALTKVCLEISMRVIATCRHPDEADALIALSEQHVQLSIEQLNVNDQAQIDTLQERLLQQPIDWLINNAGISGKRGVTVGNIERQNFLKVLETNCLGPVKISEAFLPNLAASEDKLIIIISSRVGSISDNSSGKSYA